MISPGNVNVIHVDITFTAPKFGFWSAVWPPITHYSKTEATVRIVLSKTPNTYGDRDDTRISRRRWQMRVLRTFLHTYSRDGEQGIVIRERGRWWDRRRRLVSGRTIFWDIIVGYFRMWPPGISNTTPTTKWSWGVCVAPPQGNTHTTLDKVRAVLFVLPDVRQGREQTIFLRSWGAPSQSQTNGWLIITRGFPRQGGD